MSVQDIIGLTHMHVKDTGLSYMTIKDIFSQNHPCETTPVQVPCRGPSDMHVKGPFPEMHDSLRYLRRISS